jgi:serine phosphatase RsbU (regulator of sigma subunit)
MVEKLTDFLFDEDLYMRTFGGKTATVADIQHLSTLATEMFHSLSTGETTISSIQFVLFRKTVFLLQELERTESFLSVAEVCYKQIFCEELQHVLSGQKEINDQSPINWLSYLNKDNNKYLNLKNTMTTLIYSTQKALEKTMEEKKHEAMLDELIPFLFDPQSHINIENFFENLGIKKWEGKITLDMMKILYGLAGADGNIHIHENAILNSYKQYCKYPCSDEDMTKWVTLDDLKKMISKIQSSDEKNTLFMLMILLIIADDRIDNRELDIMQRLLSTMKLEMNGSRLFVTFLYTIKEVLDGKKAITTAHEKIQELYALVCKHMEDMKSSIRYTSKFQKAILPTDREITTHFPESFIFYKPRDIVSGDFYWTRKNKNWLYFAVADCVWHGVPWYAIHVLMNILLNNAIHSELTRPNDILADTKKSFTETVDKDPQQEEWEKTKDGMEIGLFRFFTHSNGKSFVEYTGAKRPCFLVRWNGNEKILIELEPDKTSIDISMVEWKKSQGIEAYYPDGSTKNIETPVHTINQGNTCFSLHTVEIQTGDIIYTTTDGYTDQFWEATKRKYLSKKLRQSLLQVSEEPLEKQKETLIKGRDTRKGKELQTDDVCFACIKVNENFLENLPIISS